MDTTNKPSPAEMAQLRAEMRRRKILERGDERMRKLFKESKDADSQLSRSESVEERNKSLLDEIKRDPKVMDRLSSIECESDSKADGLTNGAIDQSADPALRNRTTNESSTSNHTANHTTTDQASAISPSTLTDSPKPSNGPISSKEPNSTNGQSAGKPTIDLSYFDRMEKKEKQRQEKAAITRFQWLLIHLVSLVTLKSDAILLHLAKILFACLSSYLCLNIVTPFIIAQSVAFLYTDCLHSPNGNSSFAPKLSYGFVKRILLDSLSFFFVYTIVQTFILES